MISPRDLARLLADQLLAQPAESSAAPFTGIAADSREVEPGNLFVALRGERTDGHLFAAQAVERGASALLISEPAADPMDARVPAYVVPDTLAALQVAGSAWRRQRRARVIGITGSVGKTTTREAVAGLLSQRAATWQTPRNYNGDIGLPIALLGIEPGHEWAVIEIGPYSEDEMRRLCGMAAADIAIVTNVGPTHLERFGTLADTERIKGMLPASARDLAILNGDDVAVRRMAERTRAEVLMFGTGPDAQLRAAGIEARGYDGIEFEMQLAAGAPMPGPASARAWAPLAGRHQAMTALAAAAAALHAGWTLEEAAEGLARLEAGSRLRRIEACGFTIIDDAYNAAPKSMEAALDLLADAPARRVAVLGDMLELGGEERRAHEALGAYAAARCDWLICVGERARDAAEAARRAGAERTCWAAAPEDAARMLRGGIAAGDTVLIKASHATGLHALAAQLASERAGAGAETDAETGAEAGR